jgi:hypothetical protein
VTSRYLDRRFAFDQFGPLSIRPCHGSTWAPEVAGSRVGFDSSTRTHGIRYFHGCYSPGAMTSCGALFAVAKAAITPWPHSSPSGRPDQTARPST